MSVSQQHESPLVCFRLVYFNTWSDWHCPLSAGIFSCTCQVFFLVQEPAVRPASRAADRWVHSRLNLPARTADCNLLKLIKYLLSFAGGSPNSSRVPQPLFKRVVIMLVDALREDFVLGPSGRMYMPYTRHLVERGSSHSFVAKARPPTVTMPRIKVRCYCVARVSRCGDSPVQSVHRGSPCSSHYKSMFWIGRWGKL